MMTEYDRAAGVVRLRASSGATAEVSLALSDAEVDAAVAAFFAQHEPAPVPDEVTNFQARAALLGAGLFEMVNSAILALPMTDVAYQAWEYANTVTRHGALVNAMAQQLGLTSEQLDNLFRAAAAIEA